MIKKLYILIFVLLLAGCSTGTIEYIPPVEPTTPIHQEDKNMAINLSLEHATGSYSGFTPSQGIVTDMYDNDEATSFGLSFATSGGGRSVSGYILITLDSEYFISSIELLASIWAFGIGGGSRTISWSLSYWDGSSYVSVYSSSSALGTSTVPSLCTASVEHATDKLRLDFTVGAAGGAGLTLNVGCVVCEFRVFTAVEDSGFRIRAGSSSIALAQDVDGLSPLRVRKGSSTLALLLVPTSSPTASPLRVRHNGVTYAVAKYE